MTRRRRYFHSGLSIRAETTKNCTKKLHTRGTEIHTDGHHLRRSWVLSTWFCTCRSLGGRIRWWCDRYVTVRECPTVGPSSAAVMRVKYNMKFLRNCWYNGIVGIGVDLAGILGDAWRALKVGRCRVGLGILRGVPSQPIGLGSVVSSPSGVRSRAPARNRFWRIVKATERSFLYLHVYDKIRGTVCISFPHFKFCGTCPPFPRDLRPWLFAPPLR